MSPRLTRRSLLARGAAAATALAWGPFFVRARQPRPLRIALIGLHGRGIHHRKWVADADNVVVTAACDVDTRYFDEAIDYTELKLPAPREAYDQARFYQDYRELLQRPDDFDALVISTPDHQHFLPAITAIRAGKAVLCEKPLTWSFAEARELAEESTRGQVVTQMGNQGMAGWGWRVACGYVKSGAIGTLREVHAWHPDPSDYWMRVGAGRPTETAAPPDGLDWDLWLGPAPQRPFAADDYHPRRWRGWVDFGGGILGDWVCHTFNALYKIFDPGYPDRVACVTRDDYNGESFPRGQAIQWGFDAHGDNPAFDVYWYDGTQKPPRPKELEEGRELPKAGCTLVGDAGTVLISGGHNNSAYLIPNSRYESFGKPDHVPAETIGHEREFLLAARGETAWDAPLSPFRYGAQLTNFAHLGTIAMKLNARLEFDRTALKFKDHAAANALLGRTPRSGWQA